MPSTRATRKQIRLEKISELWRENPTISVYALAKKLSVSSPTIKNDIKTLSKKGLFEGRIIGNYRQIHNESPLSDRLKELIVERSTVAELACRLIPSGAKIIIGSGSTAFYTARALAAQHANLAVITNSILVARAMIPNATSRVVLCPGNYLIEEDAVVGPETTKFLNRQSADYAILGASGLMEEGPADAREDANDVMRVMAARSRVTIVVADHTKFEKTFATEPYVPWKGVRHLVIDTKPDVPLIRVLRNNLVHIVEEQK